MDQGRESLRPPEGIAMRKIVVLLALLIAWPASAQQVIEIVVARNVLMPVAIFISHPGERYKSGIWDLSESETAAIVAKRELPPTEKSRNMLESLVRQIEADGWRQTGRGEYWYNIRFAR
jgi:hypothetical protein